MFIINNEHVTAAFSKGTIQQTFGQVNFSTLSIGYLLISSGKILVCDPFMLNGVKPLSRKVPIGSFPISLAIAEYDNGAKRIAYAKIEFSEHKISHWEMALTEGQDITRLKRNGYFGYAVDSGTGSFMDLIAGIEFEKHYKPKDYSYYQAIIDEMEKNQTAGYSWHTFFPNTEKTENIAIFSSGLGDGCYASFFGLNDSNDIQCLITDFNLIADESEQSDELESDVNLDELELILNKKQWWKFWR